MKKRLLLIAAGILITVAVLTAFVGLRAARDLLAARDALTGPVEELTDELVRDARARLQSAHDKLNSPAAKLLGFIPILNTNLETVDETAEALIPVLDSGLRLKNAADELAEDAFRGGRIRLEELSDLTAPLQAQIDALDLLRTRLSARLGGWLMPPVWSEIDDLLQEGDGLRSTAENLQAFLDVSAGLLGEEEPRTYLVLLLNNAELRGAGGLLSGVGTLQVDAGKLSLGGLTSVHYLRDYPPRAVPAPADYEERFGRFDANTTLWLNTTYSPNFADVALVAARLYKLKTGASVDGVIGLDPRGLAAMLPKEAVLRVPDTGARLLPRDLPRYVYSEAYEQFTDQVSRRDAILRVGRQAFKTILEGGVGDRATLAAAGRAVGGGHLRFVSFADDEQVVLERLGASGHLAPVESDSILVAVHNFGSDRAFEGTKLDYWARRRLRHACTVADDGAARCSTTLTLQNQTPDGLVTYVAGRPYGMLRSYVDFLVPERAQILAAELNGEPIKVRVGKQDGRATVSIYAEIPQSENATMRVSYQTPSTDEGYSLVAIPQPLTHDATIEIDLELPKTWTVRGPGELEGASWSYRGPFNHIVRLHTEVDGRTGIPGVWEGFKDFLRSPVF